MAIARPLGLILGIGAVLGAATSQAIPTRLGRGGDSPWGEVSPERYPEIVAVTYDSSPGVYYAPRAYTAVVPVIPLGRWDVLPADDYAPPINAAEPAEYAGRETVHLSGDRQQQDVPDNVAEETHDDDYRDQYAADGEGESGIAPIPAPAGT